MSIFQWTEGAEVLQIYGKIPTNERQRFINSFNYMNSEARVLLAWLAQRVSVVPGPPELSFWMWFGILRSVNRRL